MSFAEYLSSLTGAKGLSREDTNSAIPDVSPTKSSIHVLGVVLFFSALFCLFFSPVLLHNKLLAPGDGWVQSYPAFAVKRTLWTPLLWAGFPAAADPTVQSSYPIALIFSMFGNSWNAFVISAYVLASSFSYGLVYSLTRSSLAALGAGIVFGMSGFMMAHLGHTSMIHSAAWLPLLAWALTELRLRPSGLWCFTLSTSVAFSILAGHPQIFVYSLGFSFVYLLFLSFSGDGKRMTFFTLSSGCLALGVGLAAIQIIPTTELTAQSSRVALSFADFISYSLHPLQSAQMLFPYLFGGGDPHRAFYNYPYFGPWNPTELSGYVGLLPLLVAPAAFLGRVRRGIVWFWFAAGVLTFLLTLGGATPLAHLMFHVPVYNKFRVPARHLVEVSLAVSVLFGFGIAAFQEGKKNLRLSLRITALAALIMAFGLFAIVMLQDKLKAAFALKIGVQGPAIAPWSNPAIWVPLSVLSAASLIFLFWSMRTSSRFRQSLLLIILVVDLGSFGWFYEWRYNSPEKTIINASPTTEKYRMLLDNSHQRMLPVGDSGFVVDVLPNVSRNKALPSISGYGPFIYSRLSELIPMAANGHVWGDWASSDSQSLDVLSVKYVFLPMSIVAIPPLTVLGKSTPPQSDNLEIILGTGCGIVNPVQATLHMPSPVTATSLQVVSSLGCSTNTLQGTAVLKISALSEGRKPHVFVLTAGKDTAEWAYDCSDVLPTMKHAKAVIAESFPVSRGQGNACQGHHYVAESTFPEPLPVTGLQLQWLGAAEKVAIHRIKLVDNRSGTVYPIGLTAGAMADTSRWHRTEDIGDAVVFENLRALPRARLVSDVAHLKPEDILRTIRSSVMPDGRPYDPRTTALVEEHFSFQGRKDTGASAEVLLIDDTSVEVLTESSSAAFLVLSDMYYPGWKATIDGNESHLYRTDYVLRGVVIPSGGHLVRFYYEPRSFYIGAGISLLSLLAVTVLSFIQRRRDKEPTGEV